jgi:hypothetical protein
MSFIRQASIKGGFSDLLGFMRQGGKMRPLVMLAACVPTTAIVTMFYLDSMNKATPPPPTVTYFESWPADRSVEESLAANREYQKTKDAMRQRERDAYKALGGVVGMDVEKLDAEAQEEEAERRAKTEAEIAKRMGASK